MQHHGEILIKFPIPPDSDLTAAYAALTAGAKAASKIVKMLHDMGIAGATQTHRIYAHDAVHAAAERDVAVDARKSAT